MISKNKFILKNSATLIIYLSYFMMMTSDILNYNKRLSNILNYFDIISILLLIIVFFFQTFTKEKKLVFKNIIYYIFFALTLYISYKYPSNKHILKLGILLLVCKEVNYKKFIKFDLYSRICLVTLIFVLCFLGINPNVLHEVRFGFYRYTFGFSHPNDLAHWLFLILIDFCYIYSEKNSKILLPCCLSIIYIIVNLLFIGSRTDLLISVLILLYFIFRKNKIFKNNTMLSGITYSFVIFTILSFSFAYFYNYGNEFFVKLDTLFSRRLFMSNRYLKAYPITLFGNEVHTIGVVLDNAYLNILLRYGLVFCTLISYLSVSALKYLRKNDINLAYILFVFFIYGLMQTPIYIPAKNPYILLLTKPSLLENDDNKNNEENSERKKNE